MHAIDRAGDQEAVRRDDLPGVTAHCRLRAQLIEQNDGIWLLAERPLRLLRVHPRVVPLLRALQSDPAVERALRAARALSWEAAIAFL